MQATAAPPVTERGLPYIFVLDWDGTIAGKVDFQVQQYLLHQSLRKHGFKPARQHAIPPAFYPNAKLIRPGIASFLKAMRAFLGPETYFFIYTASEKSWAHQEIAWVEKTHNLRFMRPIFTRDDCTVDNTGTYRKSIQRVFPRMLKAICRKERPAFTPRERREILEQRMLLIDNNAVYTDLMDHLMLCPDYHYAVFENLLHGVPAEARTHPVVQQHIFSLVNQGLLCPVPTQSEDGMRSLTQQYKWLATKCDTIVRVNQTFEKDDFWKFLKRLILQHKIRAFTPSIIRQLQDAVWRHMRASKNSS